MMSILPRVILRTNLIRMLTRGFSLSFYQMCRWEPVRVAKHFFQRFCLRNTVPDLLAWDNVCVFLVWKRLRFSLCKEVVIDEFNSIYKLSMISYRESSSEDKHKWSFIWNGLITVIEFVIALRMT